MKSKAVRETTGQRVVRPGVVVPRYLNLMNPTIEALRNLGGSASIPELVDQVIKNISPAPEVLDHPHGDGHSTELEYQLAWARTYLKKFGMVTNSSHGVWSLTPKANEISEVSIDEVVRAVRSERQPTKVPKPQKTKQDDEPPADELDPSSGNWRQRLLQVMLDMSPSAFERLCQRLLRESGFIEVEVTGRSGDGGIDGHGIIRIAGLISFPVMFQCKRYSGNAGSSAVRDFRGAMMGRADKGLIITTGGFTRDARAEATRDGAPPIDLIDGELLTDKLKELALGVRTKLVEEVEVDPAWFASL